MKGPSKRPGGPRRAGPWLLAAALPLAGCATAGPRKAPAAAPGAVGAVIGQPLPELSLRDVKSGQTVSLQSLKGQTVLLDIWASWCTPCKEELPLLDELAGRLSGTGVTIVAASIDERQDLMMDFLARKKDWKLRLLHDPQSKVPNELQPELIPTAYLIDPSGVLKRVYSGFDRRQMAQLEQELKEQTRP